jgi:hypothetical protein
MATLLKYSARPRRVGTRLDGYTQRRLGGEASSEGIWGGTQPTFLHNLAAYCVDEAQG